MAASHSIRLDTWTIHVGKDNAFTGSLCVMATSCVNQPQTSVGRGGVQANANGRLTGVRKTVIGVHARPGHPVAPQRIERTRGVSFDPQSI